VSCESLAATNEDPLRFSPEHFLIATAYVVQVEEASVRFGGIPDPRAKQRQRDMMRAFS
jgi:hypothetical protein